MSIPALAADLRDAGLGEVEMLLEYQLPLTSKRADVVLTGTHPQTGRPSYVVVELKQWSEAHSYEDDPTLVSISAYGSRAVSHPSIQVRDYIEYLAGFTTSVTEDSATVNGIAYLHNATDHGVADLLDLSSPPGTRLFTGQRRGELQHHLQGLLAPGTGAEAADRLLGSRIAPSKQLLTLAADEVQRREMFTLLDEQRDAYLHVLHAVRKAQQADHKTVVVVAGGPGSGKSVIALSVMGELARDGRAVMHATGSRSFTQTLRKVAAKNAPPVKKMFAYFNSFMASETNDLDCLILDEAHRIRETSVNRWTKKEARALARPQIDELLSAARVPVFLLDQHQVVRPGEQGTTEGIEEQARAKGLDVIRIDLDAQFRCGGSKPYVDWVSGLLGLDGEPHRWVGDDHFSVQLADSPAQMEEWLDARRDEDYSARVVAGYCWPWSDPRPDGALVPDVQVEGWSRPWNLKGDRSIGGAPSAALWATDPAGFGQVGCVYTAQGFEFDYVGVILGPDLVLREDGWQAVRAANRDPDFRNRNAVSDEEFDGLVRNVYKVLLTRGLRGVLIYSTDAETRERLRDYSAEEGRTSVSSTARPSA